MGQKTEIQWCDATWNVGVGCRKVDADCRNCYMYRDSLNGTRYEPKEVRRTTSVFKMPLRYKETESAVWDGRPLIFTSSLTDVFIEEIDAYREEVWDIIRSCPHLIFQILTKRTGRVSAHLPHDWGEGWDNVWLGASVGSEGSIHRAHELLDVPAKVRFLSVEPLHGSVDLRPVLKGCGISWVIVGGESGNSVGKYQYRECELGWINDVIEACDESGVPVFVKQLGTHLAKRMGMADRHGGMMSEWPGWLQRRHFPTENRPISQ